MPDPRRNPAIAVLEARSRLQDEAEREFHLAGRGQGGRQLLDVFMIRDILLKRDQDGWSPEKIEKSMGLKPGVVARLGSSGMVEVAQEQGRATKGVDMV
jgi:hypothetical protein